MRYWRFIGTHDHYHPRERLGWHPYRSNCWRPLQKALQYSSIGLNINNTLTLQVERRCSTSCVCVCEPHASAIFEAYVCIRLRTLAVGVSLVSWPAVHPCAREAIVPPGPPSRMKKNGLKNLVHSKPSSKADMCVRRISSPCSCCWEIGELGVRLHPTQGRATIHCAPCESIPSPTAYLRTPPYAPCAPPARRHEIIGC